MNLKNKIKISLILYNIRSAHNVGSIFRTADAVGVCKIYLVGYTPAPVDRFGRPRADIAKSALGAEKTIPWEQAEDISVLLLRIKNQGLEITALEQSKKAIDYKKYKPKKDFALMLGNEVDGLSQDVLNLCDTVIEIPMLGAKESLNVSVATGVALYALLDRG